MNNEYIDRNGIIYSMKIHFICMYRFNINRSWNEYTDRNFVLDEFVVITVAYFTMVSSMLLINTLRPRQNGHHFPDGIFKCIFLNENVWILIEISLKFVPRAPITNSPALVEIMAWRRPGDKPLSEAMMVSLLTHICVTWPQWVKKFSEIRETLKIKNIDIGRPRPVK